MGRKTNKQKAEEILTSLSKKDLKELLAKFSDTEDVCSEVENKFIIQCPHCECSGFIRYGKNQKWLVGF